uniref:Uncharacterized protein n=1 Tax=Castor canadensis TaxID=51338 RepID=A0A8C0WR16_CASCN
MPGNEREERLLPRLKPLALLLIRTGSPPGLLPPQSGSSQLGGGCAFSSSPLDRVVREVGSWSRAEGKQPHPQPSSP